MTYGLAWFESLLPAVKPLVLLAYAAFGIFLLWLAGGGRIRLSAIARISVSVAVGALVILTSFRFALQGWLFIVCTAIGIALFALKDRANRDSTLILQSVAVVASAVSLAWWMAEAQPIGWWHAPLFAVTVWLVQAAFLKDAEFRNRWFVPGLFILFAALGFALIANTAPFEPGSVALGALMHHQGAYLGSALHIRAGLVPFYDVPLQYGLGPTLLIAATMGVVDCWSAMQLLTVSTTLIMGVLLLGMALTTKTSRGPFWRLAATTVTFAALFLWPGLINLGSIEAATPGSCGLRFLPVTLVAFLLFFEQYKLAYAALVPALLWSPEVAGMSLAVFCVHETARFGIIRAMMRTAAIAGAGFGGMAIIHHAIYHVWVQPDVMLEYVLHVPGALPINPLSDVLFLAGALGLAVWNIYRPPADALAFRRDLIAAALLFGTASYFLGRSHPNNICNLMPFITLVALRSLDGVSPANWPALPRLTIIGLSAAAGAVMLSHWNYVPFRPGFSIDSEPVAQALENWDQDAANVRLKFAIPEDLAIADMREYRGGYPQRMTVWTPVDPGSLWSFIPDERRRLYIQRSAARLHRAGWVLLDGYQRYWLEDFAASYRVEEVQRFETSTRHLAFAAHLVPLDQTAEAAR